MVSTFRWRMEGDTDLVGEPAHKLEDYVLAAAKGIEILCPNCNEYKSARFTSKAVAFDTRDATNAEREQFLTGLCTDQCWRAYLGLAH